jgi:hypothetical protein
MANVSAELQWLAVRKSNRFVIRNRTSDGRQFSREWGNASNRNAFKTSGLAGRVVSVDVTAKGQAVVVSRAAFGERKGPFLHRAPVKGGRKKVVAAVDAAVASAGRTDLRRPVLARYARIHRSHQRGAQKKK